MSVGLLLITWNRSAYVRKTLEHLLADPADFQLYWWDNGSEDETRQLIEETHDPRLVARHLSDENVGQNDPCFWFFDQCKLDAIGKIDDDILLPHGWTETIAPMLKASDQFGMLGCWPFMPEDVNEEACNRHAIEVSGIKLLRCMTIQGHSYLSRREVMQKYAEVQKGAGLPVDRWGMTVDGLISGYPLPLLMAHNMDDPRSEHCAMTHGEAFTEYSALTARRLGFESPTAYGEWIARDARMRQEYSFDSLLWWDKLRRDPSRKGWLLRRLLKPWKPK